MEKRFLLGKKLTGYNKIYLDPFLDFIGENNDYLVLKSRMGVNNKIVPFEKGISVTVEPIEWDEKSNPILTLGGMDAEILQLKTGAIDGLKTLSYPIERKQLSNDLKQKILLEEI